MTEVTHESVLAQVSSIVARVALYMILGVTSGCVRLDRFSGRATEFNVEVADSQDRTMLLNVMRSAYRFPMHFTELTTLSGTESYSTTAGLTLPFTSFNGGNSVRSGSPSATVSQSPTFNVAVLETQEFYRGMLAPLSPDQMLTYVNEGLTPEIVYSLMFGSIIYRETPTAEGVLLENNFHTLQHASGKGNRIDASTLCPNSGSQYMCFRQVLRALLARHLTIEHVVGKDNLGPPVEESALGNLKAVTELEDGGLQVASLTMNDCDKKTDACPGGLEGLSAERQRTLTGKGMLFQVQKKTSSYRFCFDELPGVSPPTPDPSAVGLEREILSATLDQKIVCRSRVDKTPAREKGESKDGDARMLSIGKFTLQVQPRSTEGLIYYLGEITRCNLELDKSGGSNCSVMPTIRIPYKSPGTEDLLFALHEQGLAKLTKEQHELVIDWFGKKYGVTVDPSAGDRSGQVLRVMAQLLALNRSAKDFPAPAVVPLLTH